MKHYKDGKKHVFEFGEMSITRIKLKQSQYDELNNYFTQQQVKNFNIPVSISLPNGKIFKDAMDNLRNEFTKDELADLGNEC